MKFVVLTVSCVRGKGDAFREIDEKPLSDANEADVIRGSYGVPPVLFTALLEIMNNE